MFCENRVNGIAAFMMLLVTVTMWPVSGQQIYPVPVAPVVTAEQKPVDVEQQIMSPLDVKDADIQDVIRTISKGYNINIILDKDVMGKVTVHLSDMPVIEGLKTLAKSNGYELVKEGSIYRLRKATEEKRSIINYFRGKLTVDVQNVDVKDLLKDISVQTTTSIVPDSKVQGKITAKLYQVDLDDGLRALLEGNGYVINKRKNIYQVSMDDGASQQRFGGQPQGRSSGSIVEYANGNLTLEVTNGNLQEVIKSIAAKSDMQIITYGNVNGEINAKFKDIPLTKALSLILGGTMFTFVQKDSILLIGDRNAATPAGRALSKSELIQLKCIKADGIMQILPKTIAMENVRVIKEQNALLVSGTSEDIISMREFLTTIDIPTPQVSIDAVIVEYSDNLQSQFGINYWLHNDSLQNKSYHNIPAPATNVSAASSGFQLGFSGEAIKKLISDLNGWGPNWGHGKTLIEQLPDNFFAALNFLESQNKAKVMAQPSIVTLNGNKASINVTQTQYYKMTTGSTLTNDYTIRFQPITFGIKLDITPWISQGGQITAEIAPEVSNSDGANADGYPNVSSRTINTTVRLNDGQTIVLGGLIQNQESKSQDKIPFLGDLPFIGKLFQYSTKTTSKTNLVVYITPHIIKTTTGIKLDSALQSLDINNNTDWEKKVKEFFKSWQKPKTANDTLTKAKFQKMLDKDSIDSAHAVVQKNDTVFSKPTINTQPPKDFSPIPARSVVPQFKDTVSMDNAVMPQSRDTLVRNTMPPPNYPMMHGRMMPYQGMPQPQVVQPQKDSLLNAR